MKFGTAVLPFEACLPLVGGVRGVDTTQVHNYFPNQYINLIET